MGTKNRVEIEIDGKNNGAIKTVNGVESALDKLGLKATGFGSKLQNVFGLGSLEVAAIGAISGMGLLIKNAIDTADSFLEMSQRIGVSVENLSTLEYAASLTGLEIESFETSIRRLSRNILDFSQGKGEAVDAFNMLGISATYANGELKNADVVMLEIADRFAAIEDGSEKTALAMKLFGRSGAELIPMLNDGSVGIEKLQAEARKLGLEISTNTAKQADAFNDNLTTLKGSFTGAANELLIGLMPALTGFSGILVDDIAPAIKRSAETTATFVKGIAGITDEIVTIMNEPQTNEFIKFLTLISGVGGVFGFTFEGEMRLPDDAKELMKMARGEVYGGGINFVTAEKEAKVQKIFENLKAAREQSELLKNSIDQFYLDAEKEDALIGGTYNPDVDLMLEKLKEQVKINEKIRQEQEQLNKDWEQTAATLQNDILLAGLDPFDAKLLQLNLKAEELKQKFAGIPGSRASINQNLQAQQAALISDAANKGVEDASSMDEDMNAEIFAKDEAEQTAAEETWLFKQGLMIAEFELAEELNQARIDMAVDGAGMMADAMSTLYQTLGEKNRVWFDAWKAFAIAEATINAYNAVLGAYKAGASLGGPILGAAYAAAAGIFSLAKIAQIASTQPGSRAGSLSASSSQPSISNNQQTTNNNNNAVTKNYTIVINSNYQDPDQLARDLIPHLKKAEGDGLG